MKILTKISIVMLLGLYLVSTIFSVSALTINSMTVNPDIIGPGEKTRITLELENEGDYDIKDVSVVLILDSTQLEDSKIISEFSFPFAPVSSTEYGIKEIEEGDEENIKFEIEALKNAQSGNYKVPVKITYIENEKEKTKTSLISININSEPIISINSNSGLLLKGKDQTINLKITNKGLADIRFLEIKLDNSMNYEIMSEENVYIGDLDSDDFENADFDLLIRENSLKNIILPVTIKYKDVLNNEYTQNSEIQLKVYSEKEAIDAGLLKKNNTFFYIALVLVLIVIYIAYKRIRKRKNNKSI
jgi:hypothetical protein